MGMHEERGGDGDWREALLRQIEADRPPLGERLAPLPEEVAADADDDGDGVEGEPPAPRPSGPDGAWHRRDFVAVDAQAFVRVAYRALLGREADPDGLQAYAPWCSTWLGRVALLQQLADSAEGRQRGVRLAGCRWIYKAWRTTQGRLRGVLNSVLLAWDAEALAQGWQQQRRWWTEQVALTLRRQRARTKGAIERLEREAQIRRTWLEQEAQTMRTRLEQEAQTMRTRLEREAETMRMLTSDASTALLEHERAIGELREQLQALRAAQEEWRLPASRSAEPPAASAAAAGEEALEEAFYVAFEDACRGDVLQLWAKLEPYLERLPQAPAQVVDLGCGRGEWLQLLQGRGYSLLGVEPSAAMVQRCREAGLPVVQADGLSWLRAQADASVDVLTAFHVVEHLPFGELLRWLREAARVLKPGGKLFVETPNPENVLVGSHTFYHDPTHRNPLTPTLLEFAFGYCGLRVEAVLRLNPYPPEAKVPGDDPLTERVNGHLCGPQDFAVIGVRP